MKPFRGLASAARWCWKKARRGISSFGRTLSAIPRRGWQWVSRVIRKAGRALTAIPRRGWQWAKAGLKVATSRRGLAVLAALAVVFVLGIVVSQAWLSSGSDDTDQAGEGSASVSEPTPTTPDSSAVPTITTPGTDPQPIPTAPGPDPVPTTSTPEADPDPSPEPPPVTPEPSPTPIYVVFDQTPPSYEQALKSALLLAPDILTPSNCRSPLPRDDLLPNAPRTYRYGVHQGVDFQCITLGHPAVAALDGRVVVVVGDYQDPDSDDRDLLLDVGSHLQATPPFTLLSLYGNYVVIDHGLIDDVGHVVTVYAHLEEVDPAIRVGLPIRAGQRVGEIGNRGTEAAANGDFGYDPHLHWELHINNLYLGAGLSAAETRQVYTTLFSESLG